MNSMTGYGFKEFTDENIQISVEIRSVNSRFLDLDVNIPSFLNPYEAEVRKAVSSKITRGKIDVNIRVKDLKSSAELMVDEGAVTKYKDAYNKVLAMLGVSSADPNELVKFVTSKDDIFISLKKTDAEFYWSKIEGIFAEVLEKYDEDRKREGENLKKDLLEKLSALDECAQFFTQWQPKMEEKFRESIVAKFQELLGNNIDMNRVMTETAALMVKYTINEEIIRLKSHLEALRNEILSNPIPGKKIDFICQEANREINTIGSKNQFVEVGKIVIMAKDALENIREQSKNVE